MAIGFKPVDATKAISALQKIKPTPSDLRKGVDATIKALMPGLYKEGPKRPGRPPSGKTRVTLLIDPAIVAKFKATGPGWQARMNDVLAAAKV